MTESPVLLEVRDLHAGYGDLEVLRGLSLEVRAGEFVALVGPNGAGKSTLLRALTGLLPIRAGVVRLGGEVINGRPPYEIAARGLAMIPEGRRLFGPLSVRENLELGAFLPWARARRDETLRTIFTLFPVLKKMLRRRGGDLSGGQQQQLAIGRALSIDPEMPKLLILDEPTEGIQPNIVHEIGDIIIKLNEAGLAVLTVEQKLPFARRVGRSFCMMDRGHAVAEGKIAELTDELVRQHLIV